MKSAKLALSKVAKSTVHTRVQIELYRFVMYSAVFLTASIIAKVCSTTNVPYIHLELIGLAPFFTHQWARVLVTASALTSIIRAAQGLFGFDQLFAAGYFLYTNINGIPSWIIGASSLGITLIGLLLFTSSKWLPKRTVRVPLLIFSLTLPICLAIKSAEDDFKTNLIGTSYGYLLGQFRFSEMLYGPYRVPSTEQRTSPTQQAADYALEHQTNLTLFLVESMGVPSLESERVSMLADLHSNDVTNKYWIEEGDLKVRGSTIHGEIRELCGGFLLHGLLGDNAAECLPGKMAHQGYTTTAIHANSAKMYGRSTWYPRIGFETYLNADTGALPRASFSNRWGNTLDTTLIDWLGHLPEQRQKAFDYVLTVSTHLPAAILPGATVGESCRKAISNQACTHIANIKLVIGKIATYATTKSNTTFVIVGDHQPPFAHFSSRSAFKDQVVPYVILRPRSKPL